MDKNSKTLFDKLQALTKDSGSIIFAIGDYYVQFAKDKVDKDIYFEAVSHHFLDIIPKNVKKDFSDLNFNIDVGNYYKKVGTKNIKSTVDDVQKIFEDIYKVNYEKEFEITDDIEYSDNSVTVNNTQTPLPKSQTQTNPLKAILIIGGIVLLAYWFFFSDDKKKAGDMKSEACIISEQFVQRQLLSPKTADFGFCEDSKIIYLGNNRYQVTNYVDASNAFGASLRKTYFLIIKYNKGQWEDISNWTLETIEMG
ncbi:MAG: hypothetical protein ABIO55_04955 [Ginsengibacter sp.]